MRLKIVIAIVLIIASLAGMYYWESFGRERVLMTDVLCAAVDIPAGKQITADDFSTFKIPNESVSAGSLTTESLNSIIGKVAAVDIPAGIQVTPSYFNSIVRGYEDGQSIFTIPAQWIQSVSDSLMPGDYISIYHMPDCQPLGKYKTAFVKADDGSEILATKGNVLNRSVAREISYIEILCSLAEYRSLYEAVYPQPAADEGFEEYDFREDVLLIVQEIE